MMMRKTSCGVTSTTVHITAKLTRTKHPTIPTIIPGRRSPRNRENTGGSMAVIPSSAAMAISKTRMRASERWTTRLPSSTSVSTRAPKRRYTKYQPADNKVCGGNTSVKSTLTLNIDSGFLASHDSIQSWTRLLWLPVSGLFLVVIKSSRSKRKPCSSSYIGPLVITHSRIPSWWRDCALSKALISAYLM
jgi:hypothetical protein